MEAICGFEVKKYAWVCNLWLLPHELRCFGYAIQRGSKVNSIVRRSGLLIAAMLLVSVLTQIFYVTGLGEPDSFAQSWADIARPTVWMIELAAFTVITVSAIVASARSNVMSAAWAALALFGLFNIVQVSMGLSMFGPLSSAGEAAAPVFSAVLAGAFFFYFLAKALLGMAAIGFGIVLLSSGAKLSKLAGILAVLSGIAAAAINIFALPQGMAHVQIAGASGTLATLFAAIAIIVMSRRMTA